MKKDMFLPVIFGYEVEAYAFARLFHESVGIKPLVVAHVSRGAIQPSTILDFRKIPVEGFDTEEGLVKVMREIEEDYPDKTFIGLTNSDEISATFAKHAREFASRWFLPVADPAVIAVADSKTAMAEIYESLGLHIARGVELNPQRPETWQEAVEGIRFPVVMKPAVSVGTLEQHAKGLEKVEKFDTYEELNAKLSALRENGLEFPVFVQQLIPGDDTTQYVVNGYVDSRGRVTAAGSGRVLLNLHHPFYFGTAAFILTDPDSRFVDEAIRVVEKIGLRGFFSFDVKVDPRDGTEYWLDLNPRPGRGHYYMKVGGVDYARALLDDVLGREPGAQRISKEAIFAIVPISLANKTYLRDLELYGKVRAIRRRGDVVNPLAYKKDWHVKRLAYQALSGIRQKKIMKEYYPQPSETGF